MHDTRRGITTRLYAQWCDRSHVQLRAGTCKSMGRGADSKANLKTSPERVATPNDVSLQMTLATDPTAGWTRPPYVDRPDAFIMTPPRPIPREEEGVRLKRVAEANVL
jgi:hypothetical protein